MLLGAVFLAGVRDIRPWHVGGKLHAVMMVESTFQIASAQSERDAWLAALWNLDDFKRSQARDARDGDWRLSPRPPVTASSESAARREFLAAMEAWDPERADRAIVGLLPFHDRPSLFELLWPLAARSFVNIGHKMIHVSQVYRALEMLDGAHREPVLRSMVHGLLGGEPGATTAPFDRNRKLLTGLPRDWEDGRVEPDASGELFVKPGTEVYEGMVVSPSTMVASMWTSGK